MLTIRPSQVSDRILCYYANPTNQIQVIQITNIANYYFEKIVFPQQRLMFETFPEALLEIHTVTIASSILSDKIPCHLLWVKEEVNRLLLQTDAA
ncbi:MULTISPECIES: DUF1830 domain-containing protein [Aerosakkonema]|uniref:DUF1830 domain-containing protein n=1 Tax=Aerosakkonema TaxID=1246629 RepID=UPI0035BA19D8